MTGRNTDPIKTPVQFGDEVWKKNNLIKIVSGAHHTLALSNNGKVFTWGDAESEKSGVC